jgi:hypothetical protein
MANIIEPWRDPKIRFYFYICDPKKVDGKAPDPLLPEHLPRLQESGAKGVNLYVTEVSYVDRQQYTEQAKRAAYGMAMLDGWSLDGALSFMETIYYRCPDEVEVVKDMRLLASNAAGLQEEQ